MPRLAPRPSRLRAAALIGTVALLLSACGTVDSERAMIGAGAAAGTVTLGPPHGTYLGGIGGSQLHTSVFGERSSTNGNRSCRQLRGCVFSGG